MTRQESTVDRQEIVDRLAALARTNFAERAARYDDEAVFPGEDFDDLFAAGLLAPTVPSEFGGLGLGPYSGDVLTLWLMTREIARVDLSMARCWEGHTNSLVLLSGMANDEQKGRWFKGVVEGGEKWVAWSGEPQANTPGQVNKIGTTIEAVDGAPGVKPAVADEHAVVDGQAAVAFLVEPTTPVGRVASEDTVTECEAFGPG